MSTESLPDPQIESSVAAAAAQPPAEAPIAPAVTPTAEAAASPVTPVPAALAASTGRYSHAQLQAMVGKRGRKPPEFYVAFPRDENSVPAAKPSVKKTRAPRAKALPAVSSAIIGDHTIDELLAMIGTTGRKPVAYDILQQAAQVFADAKAVDLPSAPVDPLVSAFAAAPKGVREAITALLAATTRKR